MTHHDRATQQAVHQPADTGPPSHDSGLQSLLLMAQWHGLLADAAKLRHEFGTAFSTTTLLLAAKSLGFAAKAVRQSPQRLHKAPLPCIAVDNEGRFFILAKVDNGQPTSSDPSDPNTPTSQTDNTPPPSAPPNASPSPQQFRLLIQRPGEPPQVLSYATFIASWSGELIFLTSKASFAGEASRFDFTWFIPAVIKYRKLLGEVLLVSFVLQLIAPLFSSRW